MRPHFVALAVFTFAASFFSQTQPVENAPSSKGRIVGTTVDDEGEVVPNATVCYSHVSERNQQSTCGLVSDSDGRFDVEVPFDTNRIYAQKMNAGYIKRDLEKTGLTIALSQAAPVAHVTVKIGAKPGLLTFHISAGDTGEPLKNAKLTWFVVDEGPGIRSSAQSGKDTMPVPANYDLIVMAEAPGYKRWFFTDPSNAGMPVLRLQSGESRSIEAVLQPEVH
jgi:hypothetical protein